MQRILTHLTQANCYIYCLVFSIAGGFFLGVIVQAQTPTYVDYYNQGEIAYKNENWGDASIYFFQYVMSDPKEMQEPEFKRQVFAMTLYSIERVVDENKELAKKLENHQTNVVKL